MVPEIEAALCIHWGAAGLNINSSSKNKSLLNKISRPARDGTFMLNICTIIHQVFRY